MLAAGKCPKIIPSVLTWTADEHAVRLPATLVQPIASVDVAQAVADASAAAPLAHPRDIAGPEVFALHELGKITLSAHGDPRPVITDNTAGLFAEVSGDAIIAKGGAQTRYREWLTR